MHVIGWTGSKEQQAFVRWLSMKDNVFDARQVMYSQESEEPVDLAGASGPFVSVAFLLPQHKTMMKTT